MGQARRRRMAVRLANDPELAVRSLGIKVRIDNRKDKLKDPYEAAVAAAEHLWIVAGMWRLADPAAVFIDGADQILDTENMLSVSPPGCYICEEVWSPETDGTPCPGEPADDTGAAQPA